ncbi:MAG: DNA polymerase II [Lentisphaerae bacterium]|nr:DNA polymerase II [Lentisphaerota bacterium]
MTDRKHAAPGLPEHSGIYGADAEEGIVAVEVSVRGAAEALLHIREGDEVRLRRSGFRPFIVASSAVVDGLPGVIGREPLAGGMCLDTLLEFESWDDCVGASRWLKDRTGVSPGADNAPYVFLNDPVHQFLLSTGKTLFRGMDFEDVRRMQVDIECETTPGYDFCNPEREGDRIIAIGMGDSTGWEEILSVSDLGEKEMLARFVQVVRERDPDVIEGHNIFNFDLPYIAARAKLHKVKLALGRDGGAPRARPSRFMAGERTISFTRFEVNGRHIMDTMFLAHAYDVSHRSLNGFGLKEVAVHFGVAAPDRTYLDASRISEEFRKNPRRVLAYLRDDVKETREVGAILSRSVFVQTQMLPYSYQNASVRGNATKIDALVLREYLRRRHSLPLPDEPRPFAGGYTDMFISGLVRNVHHCDVRSLYPSLMLAEKIAPRTDSLGVFPGMLSALRHMRLSAKKSMQESAGLKERMRYDALQTALKVLINSFYGYLGCAQARFCDFSAAEKVTARGRELLSGMIAELRRLGARPVEIDTDGIYFVPPEKVSDSEALGVFRDGFAESLPRGIEVEFDGEYVSMYSYKMKNYALLQADGEMIVKGAALKSRGLEKFQREFLSGMLRMRLEGRESELPGLKARCEKAIRGRELPIESLAKSEMLQDSPATYAAKRANGRARNAAYELALKSEREYRAGDVVTYYVTGDRKSVAVTDAAKLVSEWDPGCRDENVAYYAAKLDALYARFCGETAQGELDLGGGADE